MKSSSAHCFNFVFPDDCRVCGQTLADVTRIPVCCSCLSLPQPLSSEYHCRACRTPFVDASSLNEQNLCRVCSEGLVNFDAAYSFGSYEGTLRSLIHLFKYGKVESLAKPLSRFLIRALPLEGQFDIVIAMPMHWRKEWQRGFNQAELLAEPIAKRFGVKLARNLRRARHTKPQAGLTEIERQDNLKNSFIVKDARQLAGKRILLVDDVYTTGATLRTAAKALKDAGAAHVAALTLARVDRRIGHETYSSSPTETKQHALAVGTGVS